MRDEGNKHIKFQTRKIVTPTLVTKSNKLELNKFKKTDDNYIYVHKNGSKSYIDVVSKVEVAKSCRKKAFVNISLELQS